MEILLQGLYKASQDENEQVVKQVICVETCLMNQQTSSYHLEMRFVVVSRRTNQNTGLSYSTDCA